MENTPNTLVTKEVEHKFTSDELRNLGIMLSNAVGEVETLEQEKADFMTDLKGRLKEARAQVKLLAEKIRTGSEVRMVECRLEKDFLSNSVKTFRLDTGELVEERAMTQEERQLFLVPKAEELTGPRHVELT